MLVGQALLKAGRDPIRFQRSLAWGLRGWLLGMPAGIGLATLKSCLRLWFGVSPSRSGVNSAGNGPAMRAALLGVYFADDLEMLVEFCDRSSEITHRDVRPIVGARVVAIAARCSAMGLDSVSFFEDVAPVCESCAPWVETLSKMRQALDHGLPLEEFGAMVGVRDRVSGFIMHSVPVSLYAWLMSGNDFRRALESVIRMGGDTDTTAAIVGAICGASGSAIPAELVSGLWEWPRDARWMRALAGRLAEGSGPLSLAWPLIAPRNAIFTSTVLYHVLRRLLP